MSRRPPPSHDDDDNASYLSFNTLQTYSSAGSNYGDAQVDDDDDHDQFLDPEMRSPGRDMMESSIRGSSRNTGAFNFDQRHLAMQGSQGQYDEPPPSSKTLPRTPPSNNRMNTSHASNTSQFSEYMDPEPPSPQHHKQNYQHSRGPGATTAVNVMPPYHAQQPNITINHYNQQQPDAPPAPAPVPASAPAPVAPPPIPSEEPPLPTVNGKLEYPDVMAQSGGGELTSTSVSLFSPNWWDNMNGNGNGNGNGDGNMPGASPPPALANQFSNASSGNGNSPRQGRRSSPTSRSRNHSPNARRSLSPRGASPPRQQNPNKNEMLQDLFPSTTMHRADSQESQDVLLQTATDEFVLVVDGNGDSLRSNKGEGPFLQKKNSEVVDEVVDEEVKEEVVAMEIFEQAPPKINTDVDPVVPPSMSPIMKRLNQLEEIMVGVKNSTQTPDKVEETVEEPPPPQVDEGRAEREAAFNLLQAEAEQLRKDNMDLKAELEETKGLLEEGRRSEAELAATQQSWSETKALLADAQQKFFALEAANANQHLSADEKLREELRLANEGKAELESMMATRVKSLTNSLEMVEASLRETTEQLQRSQDRNHNEISYLMQQLTDKDTQISKLARKLTVAEVDSDWRALLGTRGSNLEQMQPAEVDVLQQEEDDLEAELEAQRKDIAGVLKQTSEPRSLSPSPMRGGGGSGNGRRNPNKSSQGDDGYNIMTGGYNNGGGGNQVADNYDYNAYMNQHKQVVDVPQQQQMYQGSGAPEPEMTNVPRFQANRHRALNSSAMGDILGNSEPEVVNVPQQDNRTYGMPSNQGEQVRPKRVQLQHPTDPTGGVAGMMDNYERLQGGGQEHQQHQHQQQFAVDPSTVHGVNSTDLGTRKNRSVKKHLEPPTVDPDGGFQSVLEGAYGGAEAVPQSFKPGRGRTPARLVNPNRQSVGMGGGGGEMEQQQNFEGGGGGAGGQGYDGTEDMSTLPVAGASPPRTFSPFNKGGKFKLNRSSAPFATTETAAKVADTMEAQEAQLMNIGMETTLLKAEMDKLTRGRKSGAGMKRMKEIETTMEINTAALSKLRRSLKQKKEELGFC